MPQRHQRTRILALAITSVQALSRPTIALSLLSIVAVLLLASCSGGGELALTYLASPAALQVRYNFPDGPFHEAAVESPEDVQPPAPAMEA
jgi:hypothetical protein